MPQVLVFALTFFVCGMALAQSETPLAPKKPISVSFEDVAVVRVLEIDSKPMIAVAKFVPKETVATTKKRVVPAGALPVNAITFRGETFVQEKRKMTVIVDGTEVEREYTVRIPVSIEDPDTVKRFTPTRQERFCPISGVQVFDLEGKVVTQDVWVKHLEEPRHVLLLREPVGEESRLDPFSMSIIREDTLLIFLPKLDADPKPEK